MGIFKAFILLKRFEDTGLLDFIDFKNADGLGPFAVILCCGSAASSFMNDLVDAIVLPR